VLKVLTVDGNADEAAIRKAKRQLSLATHPDKCSCPGAQQAFQLVTEASDALLDTAARAQYDVDLAMSERYASAAREKGRAGQGAEEDVDETGFWMQVGRAATTEVAQCRLLACLPACLLA
jgi:DnaJ-class molecular chaperone